jgi:acid phosphatase (class A)
MKFPAKPYHTLRAGFVALLLVAATVTVSTNLRAQPAETAEVSKLHYLTPGRPDAVTLLPPPPPVGSPEQIVEMTEVKSAFHSASSNDIAAAYSEKSFSVFNFASAVGPHFVEERLPKTAAFFHKVQKDAAAVTDAGKNHFQRPRPFTTDPSLANGKLEKSFGYPSGHSAESMVLALVLAEIFPDKHDQIVAHARELGWRRVQIARHYPTDIYAGRVLAQAIVQEMNKNPEFQHDLAKVKEELTTAQVASSN